MNPLKQKISDVVSDYKIVFKDEYQQFLTQMESQRELQNDDFASTKKLEDGVYKEHIMERLLYIVPERLDIMFTMALTDEELQEFSTREYGNWFAKTFSEFRVAKKV